MTRNITATTLPPATAPWLITLAALIQSTVVIPTLTESAMIQRLYDAGANAVIVRGDRWFFANEHLHAVVIPEAETGGEKAVYIHPFDDPFICEGASSIVDEIEAQMDTQDKGPPDAIICSVGGGGLFADIMQGLRRRGWDKNTKVLAVETHSADSLAQSLEKKKLVSLPGITSVADSLGAIRVAQDAFSEAHSPSVASVVLEDALACEACWRFLNDERIIVEPACGVGIGLAYNRDILEKYIDNLRPESKVVVVVCGSSKTSLDLVNKYRQIYGTRVEISNGHKTWGKPKISSKNPCAACAQEVGISRSGTV